MAQQKSEYTCNTNSASASFAQNTCLGNSCVHSVHIHAGTYQYYKIIQVYCMVKKTQHIAITWFDIQALCSQRKDQDQDQVILILFSLFYVTKIYCVLLEINSRYSKITKMLI
jgi:hypothetical protein